MPKVLECFLNSVDNSHEPIRLPHAQSVAIGRGPETKITNKRCSRHQVELTANTDTMAVTLKHTGANKVAVNGLPIQQKSSVTLKHGDKVELLLGQYINTVEFIPPPASQKLTAITPTKRKLSPSSDTVLSKKAHEDTSNAAGTSRVPDTENEDEYGWETLDNGKLLVYTAKGVQGAEKIAAYDIDGTIIKTKSGRVFPTNSNDWMISLSEIPSKLKKLWSDGYKIVFFTNQAGISRGKVKIPEYMQKVESIVAKLALPIQVFVSTGEGVYRKPIPGMWEFLLEKRNHGVKVDISQSFYCGDAACREANWAPKKKKDFAGSDRLFALNIGLMFHTPEEHFLCMARAPFKLPDFNPKTLKSDQPICDPPSAAITVNECEIIMLVGMQGSGKSHFATTHLCPKGYAHINRDSMGTLQRCLNALETALSGGQSAVVDNTNPDKASRNKYLEVATKHRVPCRCFVFTTSITHSKHNNKFRQLTDSKHMIVNDMVMYVYKNKFEEPTTEEGFSAIVKVNCVPKFRNSEHEKLYRMYLLEK